MILVIQVLSKGEFWVVTQEIPVYNPAQKYVNRFKGVPHARTNFHQSHQPVRCLVSNPLSMCGKGSVLYH